VEGVANFSWFFLSNNLFPMSRLVLDRMSRSGVAIPGISCSIVSSVPPSLPQQASVEKFGNKPLLTNPYSSAVGFNREALQEAVLVLEPSISPIIPPELDPPVLSLLPPPPPPRPLLPPLTEYFSVADI